MTSSSRLQRAAAATRWRQITCSSGDPEEVKGQRAVVRKTSRKLNKSIDIAAWVEEATVKTSWKRKGSHDRMVSCLTAGGPLLNRYITHSHH